MDILGTIDAEKLAGALDSDGIIGLMEKIADSTRCNVEIGYAAEPAGHMGDVRTVSAALTLCGYGIRVQSSRFFYGEPKADAICEMALELGEKLEGVRQGIAEIGRAKDAARRKAERAERPLLCKMLGVGVDQRFSIPDDGAAFWVDEHGSLRCDKAHVPTWKVGKIFSDTERLKAVPAPRLSPSQRKMCGQCGAKWVSRDVGDEKVLLWDEKPVWDGDNGMWMENPQLEDGRDSVLARIPVGMFGTFPEAWCIKAEWDGDGSDGSENP